jgi:Na+-driven multidrug efflux pump
VAPQRYAEVFQLAYPVVLSMLASTLMGLTDTLFMGRVSTTARGGVGLGSVVAWTLVSFFVGTLSAVNTFVARFGAESLAAHNIVIQVLHLSFMPGVGLSVAAQTLVGQSLGARDPAGARVRGFTALRLGVAYMAALGVCFLLLGGAIAGLFSPDAAVVRTARTLFVLAAAFQVFDAMGMISAGILRGAGDTRMPMLVSVGAAWLVFLPLIWIFGETLAGGVAGSWGAAIAYIGLVGSVLFVRAHRGRWQHTALIAPAEDNPALRQAVFPGQTASARCADSAHSAPSAEVDHGAEGLLRQQKGCGRAGHG